MKETLKNQIIETLMNSITGGEQIQINIVVTKMENKFENVLITYEGRQDQTPKTIIEKQVKNGYAWAATLILTLAKIKFFNTNIIIINDGLPY